MRMAIKLGGLNLLLPAVIGGVVGMYLYKMHADKETQAKIMQATQAATRDITNEVLQAGLNSNGGRYNTTPYFELAATTEWNPEELKFSGSISDAGKGYELVMPYSPI